jgi:hypothetical protein
MQTLNGKVAFTFGALALARDEQKEEGDIESSVTPVLHNGRLIVNQLNAEAGETVRFTSRPRRAICSSPTMPPAVSVGWKSATASRFG